MLFVTLLQRFVCYNIIYLLIAGMSERQEPQDRHSRITILPLPNGQRQEKERKEKHEVSKRISRSQKDLAG